MRTCDELRRASIDDSGGDGTWKCGPLASAPSSAEVVNLKHGRGGPIPDEVRAAWSSRSRMPGPSSRHRAGGRLRRPGAGNAGGADGSEEAAERGSEDDPAEEAAAAACDQAAEAAISRIRAASWAPAARSVFGE